MLALYLVLLLLILFYWGGYYITPVKVGHRYYNVINLFSDKKEAAELLSKIHDNIILLLRHLRRKYDLKIVDSILDGYDLDLVFENIPIGSSTSYTIGKKQMHICIRDKKTFNLVDYNTLMFVVLHEMAHIANYNDWGHNASFWAIFKFLLMEATLIGVYFPVDYKIYPVVYCGLTINYNPLFDNDIDNLI